MMRRNSALREGASKNDLNATSSSSSSSTTLQTVGSIESQDLAKKLQQNSAPPVNRKPK